MPALNVQGSNLYFIDPDASGGPEVVEVGCVTTLDGLTASRDQLDVTCISDEARRFEAGLLTPGAATFTILFDLSDESHARMHELYRAGTTLEWALGLADNPDTPPTGVDSDGFILPTDRSFITFEGYLSDFPWSFATGQKVTNNISVQVSDFPLLVRATT
ncbi:phage tail tube protein [Luteimonas saliphila]|uniref:phage tail tube protein n=1 Tax=Luteimonas saliphila TaxID=2804919 RepID=UPI00192DB868|nr:phage tail tube protein [Luteimonas saliphila]